MNPLFAGIPLSTLLRAALGKEAAKAPVTKARHPVPAAPPTPPSSSTSSLLPGNRKRCYDCGGGPSGSCKETVTTCGEGERCGFLERKPQPDPRQTKPTGNPSVTLIHHHPACVAAHHCSRVETEVVGDVTYMTHRDCCVCDLCTSAVASTAAPACIVAAGVTALAWLLSGLWRG
ncbi:lymphocyte antigen 6 complex locus protein G6d isoform X1 [Balaenoptera acutorostrata]|uniref:Lymphocyte antigen 6 complex locus protein G6d isoform X1 n=1 Tax=Balaenoptera acutorostrata TaxID=9767 RepID=A0ABM3U8Z6_BALAC|nr:lymphocyte antigen 6 complex locus protein G6d isoform X1 [Balaenoptera acutorostrata]